MLSHGYLSLILMAIRDTKLEKNKQQLDQNLEWVQRLLRPPLDPPLSTFCPLFEK